MAVKKNLNNTGYIHVIFYTTCTMDWYFFPIVLGIHYIGKMDPSFENRVLMDQLTGGKVEYPLMDEEYDIVSK